MKSDLHSGLWKQAYLTTVDFRSAERELKRQWNDMFEATRNHRIVQCKLMIPRIETATNNLTERKTKMRTAIDALCDVIDEYEMLSDGRVITPLCYVDVIYAIPFWLDTQSMPPEINWYTSYWLKTDEFDGQMITHEQAQEFEIKRDEAL